MNIVTSLHRLATALAARLVRPASAHCDTADGPAVVDGRRALDSGNVNIALKWVQADAEDEVRGVFERARRVRAAGGEAAALADQWFLENLVRIHRAGEGASYEGIKPIGTEVPPQVRAADEALERGSIEPLRGLIDDKRWAELEQRFDRALALKDFDTDDLVAARGYMDAYVAFFKYAEGHDHDHHAHAHTAQGHGAGAAGHH
ncbi:MAG: LysM domain-containing protein [Burkholderiales bacterium]|nr:LysM domain-containing protein [Burkholderiales bacterium]MBK8666165.1 LysM domain-containing protein [Burkholderiales bacterium]